MPHEGIPLQHAMFSDKLADTRTRKQKRAAKQAASPQQAEMFAQRDLAQFGVNTHPELPAITRAGQKLAMHLELQDPRSEEEQAADVQREAQRKTRRFA